MFTHEISHEILQFYILIFIYLRFAISNELLLLFLFLARPLSTFMNNIGFPAKIKVITFNSFHFYEILSYFIFSSFWNNMVFKARFENFLF